MLEEKFYIYDANNTKLATYHKNTTGLAPFFSDMWVDERYLYGSERLATVMGRNVVAAGIVMYPAWEKVYELHDHLGNVRATFNWWHPMVIPPTIPVAYTSSYHHMYAFGAPQPNRYYESISAYHWGFNGQERKDDLRGIGNSLEFRFRSYDSRIGRFSSVDPLARDYAWNSPYAFAENRVIDGKDLEGREYSPPSKEYGRDNTSVLKMGNPATIIRFKERTIKDDRIPKIPEAHFFEKDGAENAYRQAMVDQTVKLSEYTPFTGTAWGVNDVVKDLKEGNYWGAALGTVFLIAPEIKGIKLLKGTGAGILERITKKVGNQAEHLTEKDIQGAIRDIMGDPVLKKDGTAWNHLKEVTEALDGLGQQIDKLNKEINAGNITGEVKEAAEALRSNLQKQKDAITDRLNSAREKAKEVIQKKKSD